MSLTFAAPGGTDGWLRRRDARGKLVAFVGTALGALALRDPGPAGLALALALGLALSAGVCVRALALRLGPLAGFFLLFFVWMIFSPEPGETPIEPLGLSTTGCRRLAATLAKALAVVTLATTLLDTTPLPDLGAAAASLGVPSVLVQLLLLTQRYVFLLIEEFGRIRIALRVRGYRNRADRRSARTVGQVVGALLVRSHDRAERVHQAMACRGFDGQHRSLRRGRFRLADVAFAASACAASLACVAWDWGWVGR